MRLLVIGLNHRTAPVHTREAFAVPSEAVAGLDARFLLEPSIAEAVVLSTCNRVELWLAPTGADRRAFDAAEATALKVIAAERGLDPEELQRHGYLHRGEDALRHIMRVCASLDSLVVGEAQILAQAREALDVARSAGSVGPILERTVQAAFRCAKAVRTDTGIAEETVSIGSVAVELARRIFPSLERCRVLVIGAGKMGRVTARSLARHGVGEVVVTNRNLARADALARELGWTAKPFEHLDVLLVDADVVLTCTGADRPVLDVPRMKQVVKRRKYRPIFLVDIAVPRDIAPGVGALENVYLYNIDDLEAVSRDHLKKRLGEAEKAEHIVARAIAELTQAESHREAVPLVRAIREKAAQTARAELDRAFQRRLSDLSPDAREAVSAVVDAVLNKLLHPAMAQLRDGRDRRLTLAEAAVLLHGLDPQGIVPPDAPTAGGPPADDSSP